jgi:hypothetical protein
MTDYLVKNARGEEIGSYTDLYQAETVAEKLRAAILQHYFVEELYEKAPAMEEA